MKMIGNKLWLPLLAILLLAFFSTTSLAQPVPSGPEEDKFIGLHLVYGPLGGPRDESQWVEYGSQDIHVDGIGSVALPTMILIGQQQEDGHYLFPGLDGYNAFLATGTWQDGGQYSAGYVDLANAHISTGGEEESLSGTLYCGLPLGETQWDEGNALDYGWTAYQVFQMEDGTIYLDGSGNSYSGAMGGMKFSHKVETSVTEDNAEVSHSFEVSISIEEAPRPQSVTVKQFGSGDLLLDEAVFLPEMLEEGAELTMPDDVQWVLITQINTDGTAARSVYSAGDRTGDWNGEGGLVHQVVLLDDQGMGRPVQITLSHT